MNKNDESHNAALERHALVKRRYDELKAAGAGSHAISMIAKERGVSYTRIRMMLKQFDVWTRPETA